ncbi:MAG: ABC transporter permease [Armatimonadetes bacterium]|nr:ABC transporter permease [Armatimonadota bacterium]
MWTYILQRLMQASLVLVGASAIAFGAIFLSGDPAPMLAGEGATRQEVEEIRQRMGFDRPIYVQYLEFARGALRGRMGISLRHNEPVFRLLAERLPATLELAVSATVFAVLLGLPVGILSAVRPGSIYDAGGMGGALLAQSLPVFWLGLMLILVAGSQLRWFPISGRGGVEHLVLPSVTLGTYFVARNARMVRSSMLEVLGQDYIRTARAKGLPEWRVIGRHALRNSLIPVVTLMGLDFGALLGGAVVVETVFAWPGVGRLMIQAIYVKDFPLVQGAVLMLAAGFVVINLLVDLTYAYLEPRARHGWDLSS